MTSPPPPTAIILGAGLAGLSAALALAEAGRYRPLLIEREDRPGGLARSLHLDEFSSDLGPHRLHTEFAEVQRFIERVAAPSLMTVKRESHIYLKGQFLRYPPAPLEMAAHLGLRPMLHFMGSFAAGRLRPAPAVETYESLMTRAFGKALYEFLLRPYSAKTWKIDPAELHADTARVRVSAGSLTKMAAGLFRRERRGRETSLKQFAYLRGGAETLARHLWEQAQAAGARLELNSAVRGLELDANDCLRAALYGPPDLAGEKPDAPPRRAAGDLFLSTLPLPLLLERLLPERPFLADARQAAGGLEYLDMIFICLVVRRPRLSGDSWLYFPEPHLIFNRAYEAKNFDPQMGPPDRSLFCLEITLRRGDPIAGESDDALARMAGEQIASTGLFRADEVEQSLVRRIGYVYPLYKLDYAERLARTLDGLSRIGNLITLGRQGLFNHNNMDHSLLMGLRAARRLNGGPLDEAVRLWREDVDEFKIMRIID